jgi:hypothetical protein
LAKRFTVSLTSLGLTQTIPNLAVNAQCAQFDGTTGLPNPDSGATWSIAEAYVGSSTGPQTGVPDNLYIRILKVNGSTVQGYVVTVFWQLINLSP